jgi:Spy/CpxP family protein refolding chaperone
MKLSAKILTTLAVSLAITAGIHAQDEQKTRKRPGADGGQETSLLPRGIVEKLNLSAEQKDKIAKIEKEFADKSKESVSQIRAKMEKAKADKDRAAMQKAQAELAEVQKLRAAFETQVRELLTEEQRASFARAAGSQRPGAAGSSLIPLAIQQRLGLSDEQQQKLQALQKEFESKALQVLTDEQRQRFEEFKSRTRQPRPRQRSTEQPRTSRNKAVRPANKSSTR